MERGPFRSPTTGPASRRSSTSGSSGSSRPSSRGTKSRVRASGYRWSRRSWSRAGGGWLWNRRRTPARSSALRGPSGHSRRAEMAEHPLNILLVEDDNVDVMNVRRAFQRAHVSNPLHVASNGLEAIDMLRGDTIPRERRLVLLDLNMPRMNGIEFLRAVRGDAELRSLPVVVLTTSNDERDKVDAYNLNVAGYLLKPVTFADFVDLMAALNKYWMLVEMP